MDVRNYDDILEQIKKNELEIEHLNSELDDLNSSSYATDVNSKEQYERYLAQINKYLDQANENINLLNEMKDSYDFVNGTLSKLDSMTDTDRVEAINEINSKMGDLPEGLAEKLRISSSIFDSNELFNDKVKEEEKRYSTLNIDPKTGGSSFSWESRENENKEDRVEEPIDEVDLNIEKSLGKTNVKRYSTRHVDPTTGGVYYTWEPRDQFLDNDSKEVSFENSINTTENILNKENSELVVEENVAGPVEENILNNENSDVSDLNVENKEINNIPYSSNMNENLFDDRSFEALVNSVPDISSLNTGEIIGEGESEIDYFNSYSIEEIEGLIKENRDNPKFIRNLLNQAIAKRDGLLKSLRDGKEKLLSASQDVENKEKAIVEISSKINAGDNKSENFDELNQLNSQTINSRENMTAFEDRLAKIEADIVKINQTLERLINVLEEQKLNQNNNSVKTDSPIGKDQTKVGISQDSPFTESEESTKSHKQGSGEQESPLPKEENYDSKNQTSNFGDGGTTPTLTSPRVSLETVLLKTLSDGEGGYLHIKNSSASKLKASNIRVTKSFLNDIRQGNVLYNIVGFVPAVIKSAVVAVKKLFSKITLGKKQKEALEKVKLNLEGLSPQELEVLSNEYLGGNLLNKREISPIDELIRDKCIKYKREFFVQPRSIQLNEKLNQIFGIYNESEDIRVLMSKTKKDQLTPEQKEILYEKFACSSNEELFEKLRLKREALFKGVAKEVDSAIDLRKELIQLLSGAGVHSFEEDHSAKKSGMNFVGKRFAKKKDTRDTSLLKLESQMMDKVYASIDKGDDEKALMLYVGYLKKAYENSEVSLSAFGRRETGLRSFEVIPEELNYQNDPFVRNLFTTAAVLGSALSIYNNYQNSNLSSEIDRTNKYNADVAEQNAQINQVNMVANDKNLALQGELNQYGERLTNDAANSQEYLRRAAYDDNITDFDITERAQLSDVDYYTLDQGYINQDIINHSTTRDAFESFNSQFSDITEKVSSGAMSQSEAIRAISDIREKAAMNLESAVSEYLPVMEEYAARSPEFDLNPLLNYMRNIGDYTKVTERLGDTLANSAEVGEKLSGNLVEEFSALNTNFAVLPNEIRTSLLPAASTLLLATQASAMMDNPSKKQGFSANYALADLFERDIARTDILINARKEAEKEKKDDLNEMFNTNASSMNQDDLQRTR